VELCDKIPHILNVLILMRPVLNWVIDKRQIGKISLYCTSLKH
jgi:hypothetical protein